MGEWELRHRGKKAEGTSREFRLGRKNRRRGNIVWMTRGRQAFALKGGRGVQNLGRGRTKKKKKKCACFFRAPHH